MTDNELIQRLQQGDEPAFRWLVETFRNRVYHTALNILQDEKEAEDAAQECFIRVYETIHSFRGESSMSTWIYRIATHKALDKLRRRKARERLARIIPGLSRPAAREEFHHPGVAAEQKEKAAILFRAVASLPEKQKTAFTLIKLQGLSYKEASEIMEQPVKAIESLITRAKTKLQEKLKEHRKDADI